MASETTCKAIFLIKITSVIMVVGKFQGVGREASQGGYPLVPPPL